MVSPGASNGVLRDTIRQPSSSEHHEHRDAPRSPDRRHPTPDKDDKGWRRVVRNFTPSWFAVNMGTGVVGVLLHQLPWNTDGIRGISTAFFILNLILFVVFLAITVLRYSLYPKIWDAMLRNETQSLFLGCFPMALATLINMFVLVCSHWGSWVAYVAWGLWWFDAAVSVACCITVPFVVILRHRPSMPTMTAALLLPVVPAVVASATGSLVADVLPNDDHAITTVVVCYVLWGIGETMSCMIFVLYFQRLYLHRLPPKEVIISVFLPVGPLGQGGFAIQQLGNLSLKLLPRTHAFGSFGNDPLRGGGVFCALGIFLAFVMWGFGVIWLAFALISIATTKHLPFNMGWWGFTFPIGVLTTCTGLLGQELSSTFFKVLTMILSISVLLLWIVVTVRTLYRAYTGEIFFAPCLKDSTGEDSPTDFPGTENEKV